MHRHGAKRSRVVVLWHNVHWAKHMLRALLAVNAIWLRNPIASC